MLDSSKTIQEFLDAIAARTPTPGGGSVSALVGALASTLGEMAINFSLNKEGLEAYAEELKPVLGELARARQVLLELLVEDQLAYEAMSAIRKLPHDSPERKEKFTAAILACIRVPETIAATGVVILERCDRLVNFINFNLLGDLAVGADLAMASIRCATYSVRANLRFVEDAEDRRAIEGDIGQILGRAVTLIQSVAPRIWQREQCGL